MGRDARLRALWEQLRASGESHISPCVANMTLHSSSPPQYADASPRRYTIQARASEIDPNAREHPELNFLFTDPDGKIADQQNAAVDTRVASEGKLVIWLMAHNEELFQRLTSYGYHAIQPQYVLVPHLRVLSLDCASLLHSIAASPCK
jgi:hypothetical protein